MPHPIAGAPSPDPGLPAALRDLAAVLTPGSVISGRILAALGDGAYAVQVRGRTLVAQSGTPLTAGSVVQVQVDSVGDQIQARLVTDAAAQPPGRLAALGLPATPAAMLVLEAFERAGAPLVPDRLQAATAQVTAASTEPAPSASMAEDDARSLPPPERLATAHALLARTGLPASPPLVGLALAAATDRLPDVATALVGLRQAATAAGLSVAPASAQPVASATTQPSAPMPVPTMVGTVPAAPASVAAANPASASVSSPMVSAGMAPSPLPSANQPPVPSVPVVPASSASAPTVAAPGPGLPVVPTAVVAPVAGSQVPVSNPPVAVPVTAPSPAAASLGPQAIAAPSSSSPAAPATPAAAPDAADPLWRAVLAEPLPDAQRDGASAALRALALAGLRMKASVESGGIPAPSVRDPAPAAGHAAAVPTGVATSPRHLLALLPLAVAEAPAAARTEAPSTALPSLVAEAVVRTVHEQSAQTVFPPDDLADYDRVLGLPLMADGRPVPARVAVASRTAPSGAAATFLRVDAELSRLGPVSIRLSGIEGGALAITLMAGDAAAQELAADLPDLVEDLRRQGIAAGVRVVDEDGAERAGAASHDG